MKILIYKLVFILFCLLCSCSAKKSLEHKKQKLSLPLHAEISSIDPARCYDEGCNKVMGQIYEPLLEYHYKKRPYELKPLLASEMPHISEDKKTYTFKIKPNIKYQNTQHEVHAKDFVLAIKRIAYTPTESRGWWLFDKKVVGLNEFRKKAKTLNDLLSLKVEGLKIIDPLTFSIELTQAFPQFIYAFAMNFTAPIPEFLVKKNKNIFINKEHIAATGPYILTKWVNISKMILTKNPHYHQNELPKVKTIEFPIIKEAPTRWLNFISGKLDILTLNKDDHDLAFNSQGHLKSEFQEKRIQALLTNSLTYWWLSFNMNHSFLGKNLHLRKAIAHAIDSQKFIRLFTHNLGQAAGSIYPPGIFGHSNQNWPINFDLELAKKELKKAGFPNGEGLPTFNYDLRNSSSTRRQMGEFYQSQLARIGIKLNIIPNTFANYLKKAREGKLQIWQDGWIMDYPDPENSLQLLYSKNKAPGPNVTSFSNKEIDSLYLKLQQTSDKNEQAQILKEAEDIIKSKLPWHMLYYSRYHILTYKRVKNFIYSDVIHNWMKYLEIAP